jgi:hypothetical protein
LAADRRLAMGVTKATGRLHRSWPSPGVVQAGARNPQSVFPDREVATTGDGFLATCDGPPRGALCSGAHEGGEGRWAYRPGEGPHWRG